MSRIADIAQKATIMAFGQGLAQESVAPIAGFLAPTVEVDAPVGYYKEYSSKSRFRIPNTARAAGQAAVQVGWDADDKTYNCKPNSLDVPVDIIEEDADEGAFQDALTMAAEVGALSHEKQVINAAMAALGAGTDVNVAAAGADLVKTLDQRILAILKAAGYGSLMGVGVLFGPDALEIFRNHASVKGRFVSSTNQAKQASGLISVTEEDIQRLLIGGKSDVRTSFMVHDTAPEGKDPVLDWLMPNSIVVFAKSPNPTRRDPSFMKTFRLRNRWMQIGAYKSSDERSNVAKIDWSASPVVTNASAAIRLNLVSA